MEGRVKKFNMNEISRRYSRRRKMLTWKIEWLKTKTKTKTTEMAYTNHPKWHLGYNRHSMDTSYSLFPFSM